MRVGLPPMPPDWGSPERRWLATAVLWWFYTHYDGNWNKVLRALYCNTTVDNRRIPYTATDAEIRALFRADAAAHASARSTTVASTPSTQGVPNDIR